MQNLITGKYVVLNIGYFKTKILHVKATKQEAHILDKEEYETPTQCVNEYTLKDFRKLYDFVRECLTDMMIKTTQLVIVTDLLDLEHRIKEYAVENGSDLDSTFELDDEGKRYPNNTTVGSFKRYSQYVTEEETLQAVSISRGKVTQISALYKEFKDNGLEIISLTNEAPSVLANCRFMRVTYDDPCKLIVHFDSNIKIFYTSGGCPKNLEIIDFSTRIFLEDLMGKFELSRETALMCLYEVGLERTTETENFLFDHGVQDINGYFNEITLSLGEAGVVINDKIKEIISENQLDDDVSVYGIGDMFGMPGIENIFDRNIKKLSIGDETKASRYLLVNKTDSEIGPEYMTGVGEVINPDFEHNINLIPKEKFSLSIDGKLLEGEKFLKYLSIAAVVWMMVSIWTDCFTYINFYGIEEDLSGYRQELMKAKASERKLDEYIEAAEVKSDYLDNLIGFIKTYNNSIITIASIDTASTLRAAQPQPVPQNVTPEGDAQSSEAQTTDGVPAAPQEDANVSAALGVVKEDLIVRGYSSSTAAISQMFEDIQKFDFVEGCVMNSIRQEVLPTLETIYVYEMTVSM